MDAPVKSVDVRTARSSRRSSTCGPHSSAGPGRLSGADGREAGWFRYHARVNAELLPDGRILAAYLIFAGSYVVFALGTFPWMKIDRPGAACTAFRRW